ncbi:DinB family protein [Dyadobacter sp. Leaf189]|uniref:DinB family protein n=1 Tax=Dyadobacter sp. Leaf189 TaxID=1736295 RepID=UPI000A4DAC2D|nr:DinB family protein [Dyadobacter sp. Leaf189]
MNTKRIEESILIQAPDYRIWQVITDKRYNGDWLVVFGMGNIAESDWQEGSKALFMDESGNGLAGTIDVSRPFEEIRIVYNGIVTKGVEDYESDIAKQMRNFDEVYLLSRDGDSVRMRVFCDMDEVYFDDLTQAWKKALEKIKELAEKPMDDSDLLDNETLAKTLEQTTAEYLSALTSFSADQVNIVPFEGSWTAGQVTDHLLKSETGLPKMMMGKTAPTTRPVGQTVPQIEDIFLDFSTRLQAPDFNIPDNGPYDLDTIIGEFKAERAAIAEIARSQDLTLSCAEFPFPQVGELTRYEWIYFVVCHSRRHAHQLRNILEKVTEKVAG